jgi:hypothetical protein
LAPEEFGSSATIHNVAPNALVPRVATWNDCQLFFSDFWQPAPAVTCFLGGNWELPAGVLLNSAQVFYNDAGANTPSLALTRINTAGVSTTMGTVTFPAGTPGDTNVTFTFPAGTIIDNLTNTYGMELSLPQATRYYRTRLRFQRRVSPGPAVATFTDVPTTSIFFQFIEALAASGITAGCTSVPGGYCPGEPVTRAQMAAFLAIALGLHHPN